MESKPREAYRSLNDAGDGIDETDFANEICQLDRQGDARVIGESYGKHFQTFSSARYRSSAYRTNFAELSHLLD